MPCIQQPGGRLQEQAESLPTQEGYHNLDFEPIADRIGNHFIRPHVSQL